MYYSLKVYSVSLYPKMLIVLLVLFIDKDIEDYAQIIS